MRSGFQQNRSKTSAAPLTPDPVVIAPRLQVSEEEVAQALLEITPLASATGIQRPVFFGLNPGAEYGPAKRWPAERFISVAAEVQRRTHCRWLIFGGGADLCSRGEERK